MKTTQYTNIAFISYKREDEKWAKWLQAKLEHYKLPTEIRKQYPDLEFAKNPRHVFKDTTDLSGGVLAKAIKDGLDSSKFLIVICSPRAAKSEWVCKEVQDFIDSGREEYIIPFIIDGEPYSENLENECFPEALKSLAGERELLGININENGRDSAAVKVVARLFELRFDVLWDRFQREKRKRFLLTIVAFVISILVGSITYLYIFHQQKQVEVAKYEKSLQEAYSHYLECQRMLDDSQYTKAFTFAKDILQKYDDVLPDSLHDRYEFILRKSYQALNTDTPTLVRKVTAEFPEMDWGDMPVQFSETEDAVYIGCGGLSKININTGKKMAFNDEWPSEIRIGEEYLVCFENLSASWYDKVTLKKVGETDLKDLLGTVYLSYVSSSKGGERCLMYDDTTNTFAVCDVFRKCIVRTFASTNGFGSISGNGKILALVENEKIKLFDIDTGNEIYFTDGCYAEELQYDQSGDWLLLYLKDYNCVRILNIITHEDYLMDIVLPEQEWGGSFNFTGQVYGNKYIVSEDGNYVAIAGKIYDMPKRRLFLELADLELAQSVWISNDAQKIIQVNYDRTIYTYTRKGHCLFQKCNLDFDRLLDSYQLPKGIDVKTEDDIVIYDNGQEIGRIENPFTDVYLVCVSKDKKHALVSAMNKPTTLYNIKTGLAIEEYPFTSGDGDIGFGVIGNSDTFYYRGLDTVFKYQFMPLNELLKAQIK